MLRKAQHRIAEGAADGEIVHVGDDGGALVLLAAPPGRDIGQAQILAHQLAAEFRHEAHHRGGFEHARAERIGERHPALADGLDEAGDAKARLPVEFERIGEIAVDAPPDHIGALQPGDGAHMHLALAHGEIAALDQNEAEIAGEIGLFEIGFVERAGRPQADARIGAIGERGEAGAERLEEGRQPLDVHVAVKRRERAGQHQPVGQRIAGAGGRLGAIAEHPPPPVGTAAEIGGEEMQEFAARRRHAMQGMQKIGRARDGGGRQIAGGDQRAGAVDVGEDALHQLGALLDPLRDLAPLIGLDEERQVRQRPGALARVAIAAVGDAGLADMAVGGGEAAADVFGAEIRHRIQVAQPIGARAAVLADELVGDAGERLVIGDQRREALGRGRLLAGRDCVADAHEADCFGRKDLSTAASVSSQAAPMRSRQ